jgi:hypothetical protein
MKRFLPLENTKMNRRDKYGWLKMQNSDEKEKGYTMKNK